MAVGDAGVARCRVQFVVPQKCYSLLNSASSGLFQG
jgi:hypothetical protein